MSAILEVCAFNIQSCVIAAASGASRIELCDSPADGGTTPSYGLIKQAKAILNIPVFPIIRPRGGSFLYDENDIAIMKADIEMCKELGCEGISIGAAMQDGRIDTELMAQFVACAAGMEVTCHRVFDLVPDPFEALEQLIACGVKRVLTSGQKRTALEGAATLAQLVQWANGRIIILAGGGVRAANIAELMVTSGVNEFHTAAKMTQPDIVPNEHPGVLDIGSEFLSDAEELQKMVSLLG
ncbi:copper homeostasis protein CutC [Taibaiella soli]|uniref:PF03932 family protein CutC n=1 Tax=Taibaiella soli TaxID=1649169 RepID=A0A2W2AHN2_9BACT|nr:copper homeostasis protein CutC [Taibaiella soli]PZF75005.1 copper homeostasis protein CutC [Taibaiella soli]